ncbi:MAG: DUF460 domain-containing protein [Euryarchaeota archaeon]|nr:DUF460 domain-containing protein [Euryarchaeota archaeon]
MKVLGIDLLAGSPNAKAQPRYSAVLLEDGRITLREELPRGKLLRFIREARPERLAVDNIFELFPKKKLRPFFYSLPRETQVVQVTGAPGEARALHIVAKNHGIKLRRDASSMEEAEACALLAYMNVGCVVELFEKKTRIIVSRARSLTRGGQSKDRYRRKVHNNIAMSIKEIKAKLRELKVDFTLETVRADSGYSRGEFLVYAPRSELRGIKSARGSDVQIKVLPVEKSGFSFTPLGAEKATVILGVDPGTTTAVAALSLEGELLEVASRRDFTLHESLLFAAKYRAVAMVASDVTPAPRFVERLASKLNAVLFTPAQPLAVEEKIRLVEEKFGKVYRNPHERDAIAAALKAYNAVKSKLENIERRLLSANAWHLREEVKLAVLRGESLERALARRLQVEEQEEEEEAPSLESVPNEYRGIIRRLRSDVRLLKEELREKEREIERKDRAIAGLKRRLREALAKERRSAIRDEEVKKRERAIAELRKKLEALARENRALKRRIEKLEKELELRAKPELEVVKVLPKLTREEVLSAKERLRLGQGDVVLIEDVSGAGRSSAEELVKLKPRAIILEQRRLPHPAREVLEDQVLLSEEELSLRRVADFAVVEKRELEEAIERKRAELAERRAAKLESWLEKLITDYRTERELLLKRR